MCDSAVKNTIVEYGEAKYKEGFINGLFVGSIVGVISMTIGFIIQNNRK